jgi:hypothetical protein
MEAFWDAYWCEIVVICVIAFIPGCIAISCWRDYLKGEKLKKHPERMNEGQYRNYNRERFNGK